MMQENTQTQKELNKNSSLRFITLGRFAIVRDDGTQYRISSRSNKLWNLFKYLLVNKDRGIASEIILEQIYPDEEYDDPQNVIQNMIYRLRKLLAAEQIFEQAMLRVIFANGGYQLELSDNVWLDQDEFRRLTKKAEMHKNEEHIAEAIDAYEKALDIYGGELLPELVAEGWVIPRRTLFGNLYLKSVLQLTQLYQQQNSFSQIVQILQKAVTIDPNEEELHIRLMETFMYIGKYREAKRHYDETIKYYKMQFGISPTSDMQRIEQMLKADRLPSSPGTRKIDDDLIEKAENRGAFYVEYRDFYAIYVLEKRKSERSGVAVCPVIIDFEHPDNIFSTESDKNTAVDRFRKQLIQRMRRGDMITLFDKAKFLVMLPELEYEQIKVVIDREIHQFKQHDEYTRLTLEALPFPVLPVKE